MWNRHQVHKQHLKSIDEITLQYMLKSDNIAFFLREQTHIQTRNNNYVVAWRATRKRRITMEKQAGAIRYRNSSFPSRGHSWPRLCSFIVTNDSSPRGPESTCSTFAYFGGTSFLNFFLSLEKEKVPRDGEKYTWAAWSTDNDAGIFNAGGYSLHGARGSSRRKPGSSSHRCTCAPVKLIQSPASPVSSRPFFPPIIVLISSLSMSFYLVSSSEGWNDSAFFIFLHCLVT